MGGGWGNAVVNPKIFDSMPFYDVIDVPQKVNCENCTPCMRMRLLEMGFITGQKLEVEGKRLGLYIVHMVSSNGVIEQTFALREEELERICLNELI